MIWAPSVMVECDRPPADRSIRPGRGGHSDANRGLARLPRLPRPVVADLPDRRMATPLAAGVARRESSGRDPLLHRRLPASRSAPRRVLLPTHPWSSRFSRASREHARSSSPNQLVRCVQRFGPTGRRGSSDDRCIQRKRRSATCIGRNRRAVEARLAVVVRSSHGLPRGARPTRRDSPRRGCVRG